MPFFRSCLVDESATGVDVVSSITHLDCGTREPAFCATWRKRHVCVVAEFLKSGGGVPGIFRDPQINELVVVELNIPGITLASFDPIKLTRPDRTENRVRTTGQMTCGTEVRVHGHPVQHVICSSRTADRCFCIR